MKRGHVQNEQILRTIVLRQSNTKLTTFWTGVDRYLCLLHPLGSCHHRIIPRAPPDCQFDSSIRRNLRPLQPFRGVRPRETARSEFGTQFFIS
eukprot:1389848-Amorphochlora_amoeboformis.AAC.1